MCMRRMVFTRVMLAAIRMARGTFPIMNHSMVKMLVFFSVFLKVGEGLRYMRMDVGKVSWLKFRRVRVALLGPMTWLVFGRWKARTKYEFHAIFFIRDTRKARWSSYR